MRTLMKKLLASVALAATSGLSLAGGLVPAADHHQHLFSPAIVALINSPAIGAVSADTLIANLDAMGIARATVLSTAYMYGNPSRSFADEYALVKAENDWTAAQVARYPARLVAFCGVHPLRPYALQELARCAADPFLRRGVKLHFGNGDIQLEDPAQLARLKLFFRAVNGYRMAVVIHARANIGKQRPYGRAQARIVIEQLLPLLPDVTVQIAHLAGTGPGFEDPPAQQALAVYAEAAARNDPRMKRVWFDVASNAHPDNSPASTALLVQGMRQIGMDHLLYGSDSPTRMAAAWQAFRQLPLTDQEFATIAANVAPYLRETGKD